MNLQQAVRDIIAVGRRMYDKGFIIASDGNLSVRMGNDRLLVTCSGVCKGELTPLDLVECDIAGQVIKGGQPSSEIAMHIMVYQRRPDVQAVVHAHPSSVVAVSLAGLSLMEPYLPEIVMTLGEIPTASFAAPSTDEGAQAVRDLILDHDAIILDRHGSLTVGKTLWDAYWKLEQLDFAARVVIEAKRIGQMKTLTSDELERVRG